MFQSYNFILGNEKIGKRYPTLAGDGGFSEILSNIIDSTAHILSFIFIVHIQDIK